MIQLGFIGLGGMGIAQARAFAEVQGGKIFGGADVDDGARSNFVKLFPDAEVWEDYRQLLAHPGIDAVVIAVPTGLHQEVASAALAARKPVLLEKPMARTVAECQILNDQSQQYSTVLMVAHCRRFDPYWGAWAKFLRSGEMGEPVLWRHIAAGMGPGRWFMDDKLGGGPLLDGAVHNYDFANWLFGDPESVIASSIELDPHVSAIDTGSTVVRYPSGHQLLLSWSWGTRGCSLHDIIGPKGFIQFGTGDLVPPAEEEGQYNYCCFTDVKGQQTLIKAKTQPNMYANQAEHFLACVRGEATCLSPGIEAIKAVAVAEAVLNAGPDGRACKVRW